MNGAIGAGVSSKVMPGIADALEKGMSSKNDKYLTSEEKDDKASLQKGIAKVFATVLGVTFGNGAGAVSALNVEANNRQLHPNEIKWIKENKKDFASLMHISEDEAEKRLAAQAYRQVQYGVSGEFDREASSFLHRAHDMLPADGDSGGSYMFYATPEQKTNPYIYANELFSSAENIGFYSKNDLRFPSIQEIEESSSKDQAVRSKLMKLTKIAGIVSGVVAGGVPVIATCVGNLGACGMNVLDIVAGDALGPAGIASIGGGSVTAVRTASEMNAAMRSAGKMAAWKEGTKVVSAKLEVGTRIHMVVDRKTAEMLRRNNMSKVGNWIGFDASKSVDKDMRQGFAVTSQFKPEDAGPFYNVELEVTKPLETHIGFAGPQKDGNAVLEGGRLQGQILIPHSEKADHLKVIGQPTKLE